MVVTVKKRRETKCINGSNSETEERQNLSVVVTVKQKRETKFISGSNSETEKGSKIYQW